MSVGRHFGRGSWFVLSLLLFAGGGFSIHRANQYAGAAPAESTTTTDGMFIHKHYRSYLATSKHYEYFTCSYEFNVDGVSYSGDESCPQRGADDSIKEKLSDTVPDLPGPNATVYYDPANPSMHSLKEFSAKSEAEYQSATALISLAFFINLPYVFLAVYAAMKNKGNRGVFVDAQGTVIYPDQVDFTAAFGELPGESGRAAEPRAAARDKAARDAQFAASHGLRELYLDVVKQIHPDHASNEADRSLRERLTKEANAAFERGDDATLRRVLEEYTRQAPRV
jgi:hypothetical protein